MRFCQALEEVGKDVERAWVLSEQLELWARGNKERGRIGDQRGLGLEEGKQSTWGLGGHAKDFSFYSGRNGEPLVGFEARQDGPGELIPFLMLPGACHDTWTNEVTSLGYTVLGVRGDSCIGGVSKVCCKSVV